MSSALIFVTSFFVEGIIDGSHLGDSDRAYIASLGLLENDENIILFSSGSDHKTSGNFFTAKKVVHYWNDSNDPKNNSTAYANYNDIDNIIITYSDDWVYATKLKIELLNDSSFYLYINDDNHAAEVDFYNRLIEQWQQSK